MLTTSRVQPKKPSKALFMQSLVNILLRTLKNLTERSIFECFTDDKWAGPKCSRSEQTEFIEDAIPKQLVLLCSEKAVYSGNDLCEGWSGSAKEIAQDALHIRVVDACISIY
ncbi:hypothetical protein SO802_023143 [Lithocarpus litseifolius]|uniref:Uncharacterized protein n=1 Tax=Lithocarpus litseifolius TaxID=425828 RepID=A0AAW2C5B7_9ROSI